MFRRPSFTLAEITWRWVFGSAATVILCFAIYEYLHTLPVSGGDLLFLRSHHPILVSRAIAHIFAGSARRLVEALLIAIPCLAILWIAVASLGRAATLRSLLEYFQTEAQSKDDPQWKLPLWHGLAATLNLHSLVGLNFFRVALALAAFVGLLGAAFIASFVSPKSDPSPALVFLVFLMLALLVGTVWSFLNWLLSLAAVFVVRDAQDTFGSLAASVDFFQEHTAAVLWSSIAFGVVHLAVFMVASSVVFLPTMFLGLVPPGLVLIGVLFLTMMYFAVVDWLYMGRLAAYVCILECPRTTEVPAIPSPTGSGTSNLISVAGESYNPSLFPPAKSEDVDSGINISDRQVSFSVTATESNQASGCAAEIAGAVPSNEDDILSDVPGLVPPPEDKQN
jgi:hypothetical protein